MESRDCMYLCSNYEKEISVCNDIPSMESDSFQVDMEPFSHPTNNNNKDHTFSSKSNVNLSRSLSKNGEGKKKMMINPSVDDERDATFSLKATSIMSETSVPGAIDPQNHHQVTIIDAAAAATGTTPSTRTKLIGKRSSSFKQSSIINPTRIVFFFATLSSMGTILLICFTLSMAKYNGDRKFID